MNSFANGLQKRANHLIFLFGLTGFLVVLGFYRLQSHPIMAETQQVQVVELKAKKYEFDPSPVHVKAGTKVQLKITAIDHDHGFKIAMYPDGAESSGAPRLVFTSAQDCWLLKKGETTMIEFTAQTPGTYPFRCCHTCGLGHRGMKGELIVE
jgi:heme/copper-type cytochrome/quinol oxidase subunit 2